MGLPPGWAVWLPGSEFPVSEGDAATMDEAREQAGNELRRLARQRTRIKITRCHDEKLRGGTFGGHTADTIARRLFGRSACAIPSPDPANRGQGMIVRTDRYGTHVLADYTEHRP